MYFLRFQFGSMVEKFCSSVIVLLLTDPIRAPNLVMLTGTIEDGMLTVAKASVSGNSLASTPAFSARILRCGDLCPDAQYSSASITVMILVVTLGSDGSGDPYSMALS